MERGVRIVLMMVITLFAYALGAQPTVVKDIPNDSKNFVEIGDLVYFTSGNSLWRSDGTDTGSYQLASGFMTPPFSLREFKGYALFLVGADHPSIDPPPTQLWRTDGTPEGTVQLISKDFVSLLESSADYYFFLSSDGTTGQELYRTDGTISGTILLKDIYPGPTNGFRAYSRILNDELVFAASDATHGVELWKSDGTPNGTALLKDISPGPGHGIAGNTNSFVHNGLYYFKGNLPEYGGEPWVSDGTPEGTYMLVDAEAGPKGSMFVNYAIGNKDDVYFYIQPVDMYDVGDLWKTAGTPASTSFIGSVGVTQSHNDIHSFRVYEDKVYFWNRTEFINDNLWVTDGTRSGTYSFFDIITVDGGISFFEVINDYLVFTGDAETVPYDLYRSDGTREGTKVFAKFKARAYGTFPRDLTKVGDLVFYADHDGLTEYMSGQPYAASDRYHLFEADGDTTRSMRALWSVNTPDADNITPLNGKVVFTASHEGRRKLWLYDPAVRPAPEATFTLVHAGSDEDLRRLTDGALVVNPWNEPLNIRFNPVESAGSVLFKINGRAVRIENAPPYSLNGDINGDYATWEAANPGTYTLTATAFSQARGQGTPGETLTITFKLAREDQLASGQCSATGTILREYWDNVSRNEISAIPLATEPTSTSQLTIFETPTDTDTNFGARISGYICAPATGNYTFWIASNDHSELWLSTDEDPANKRRIAYLNAATNPRQWDKFSSQRSSAISLTAGQTYYIEALHKQGIGTAHIAVGWQLPDGSYERPIGGNRLSPADMASGGELAAARVGHGQETANDLYSQISIYPNPAASTVRELTISGYEGIDQMKETHIEIRNLTGEVVYAHQTFGDGDFSSYSIPVAESLTPGVYMVTIVLDGRRISKRLLVK